MINQKHISFARLWPQWTARLCDVAEKKYWINLTERQFETQNSGYFWVNFVHVTYNASKIWPIWFNTVSKKYVKLFLALQYLHERIPIFKDNIGVWIISTGKWWHACNGLIKFLTYWYLKYVEIISNHGKKYFFSLKKISKRNLCVDFVFRFFLM